MFKAEIRARWWRLVYLYACSVGNRTEIWSAKIRMNDADLALDKAKELRRAHS
jgi:hypothetical protein